MRAEGFRSRCVISCLKECKISCCAFCPQTWRCAVCWKQQNVEGTQNHHKNASELLMVQTWFLALAVVLVRYLAWQWLFAVTIGVSGVTMLASSSSCSEDLGQQSFQLSVECPAGLHVVADRHIRIVQLLSGERSRNMNQQRKTTPCLGKC